MGWGGRTTHDFSDALGQILSFLFPQDPFLLLLFCTISFSDALNMSFKLLVETIVDVYTVEQLKEKALQSDVKLEPIYGVIYGYISTLNIDDNASKVVRNRW